MVRILETHAIVYLSDNPFLPPHLASCSIRSKRKDSLFHKRSALYVPNDTPMVELRSVSPDPNSVAAKKELEAANERVSPAPVPQMDGEAEEVEVEMSDYYYFSPPSAPSYSPPFLPLRLSLLHPSAPPLLISLHMQ